MSKYSTNLYIILCHFFYNYSFTYIVDVYRVCVYSWLFSQNLYMLELTQSLLKNLRKSTIVPADLLPTCHKQPVSMDDPATCQDCKKTVMEPYFNPCYSQNNATTMYNAMGNLIYCQTDTTNCMHNDNFANSVYLEARRIVEKQRYKAMRKWKRFGKGKNRFLLY